MRARLGAGAGAAPPTAPSPGAAPVSVSLAVSVAPAVSVVPAPGAGVRRDLRSEPKTAPTKLSKIRPMRSAGRVKANEKSVPKRAESARLSVGQRGLKFSSVATSIVGSGMRKKSYISIPLSSRTSSYFALPSTSEGRIVRSPVTTCTCGSSNEQDVTVARSAFSEASLETRSQSARMISFSWRCPMNWRPRLTVARESQPCCEAASR